MQASKYNLRPNIRPTDRSAYASSLKKARRTRARAQKKPAAYVLPHIADTTEGRLPVGCAYNIQGTRVDWRCADVNCRSERCITVRSLSWRVMFCQAPRQKAADRKRDILEAESLNGIKFGQALGERIATALSKRIMISLCQPLSLTTAPLTRSSLSRPCRGGIHP